MHPGKVWAGGRAQTGARMLPGVQMPAGPRSRPPPRPCPPAAAQLHKAPGACISRSGARSPKKRRKTSGDHGPEAVLWDGSRDLSPSPAGESRGSCSRDITQPELSLNAVA